MSQLVDANPYKKMAFLDSQKAKVFPAAQPQWCLGGLRGVQSPWGVWGQSSNH